MYLKTRGSKVKSEGEEVSQFVWCLESVDQVNEERVADVLKNCSLGGSVCKLVSFHESSLSESLESIQGLSGVIFLLHKHDLPEGPFAEDLQELKVINSERLCIVATIFSCKLFWNDV
jgi:hypothetical protein